MSPKKSEAERQTAKAAPALATHYRAIGPAAIAAALLCAVRKTPVKAAIKAA
ncbi:transcriptional regulator [Mesorhizobium marinum]|uniref:Transcriptional regulator n=1 Tax=Mesorhizobium marinum TaxID=3228790 RepID=A0ABV3R0C6_9HYPH